MSNSLDKIKKSALASIVATSMLISGCTSKETKSILEKLEKGDYKSASKQYSRDSESIDYEKIADSLDGAVDSIYDDFISGDINAADAILNLDYISSMADSDLRTKVQDKINDINLIQTSRDYYDRGVSLYNNGDYLEAINAFKQVVEEDEENYSDAISKIEDAQEAYKNEIVSAADSYANNGNYVSAIRELNNARDNIEDSSEFDALISGYISSAIDDADSYASSGDYDSAIQLLESIRSSADDVTSLDDRIFEYQNRSVENALATANSLISSGDYVAALNELSNYSDVYEGNEIYDNAYNQASTSYVSEVSVAIQERFDVGDYGTAYNLCLNALTVVPESAELQNTLARLESFKPDLLSELTISESSYFDKLEDITTDVVGNSYGSANLYNIHHYSDGWGYDELGYAHIYTGSAYVRMTGTVVLNDSSDTGTVLLDVYSNDDLIYTVTLDRTTTPQDFELDITGAEFVKITTRYPDGSGSYKSDILLSNVSFYKQ